MTTDNAPLAEQSLQVGTPSAFSALPPEERETLMAYAKKLILDSLTHEHVVDAFRQRRAIELTEVVSARAAADQADAEILTAMRAADLADEATEAERVREHFAATLESGVFPVSAHGQPLASGCI